MAPVAFPASWVSADVWLSLHPENWIQSAGDVFYMLATADRQTNREKKGHEERAYRPSNCILVRRVRVAHRLEGAHHSFQHSTHVAP